MFSQATLKSLLLVALAATSYASTSRYTSPLPEGAAILNSDNDLKALMEANPNKVLDEFNGGYVIREGFDGPAVAYTSDEFSKELDQRVASAKAFNDAVENKGISENDLYDVFSASSSCSHPHCVTPGSPGKCPTYTGCYICSSSGSRCI